MTINTITAYEQEIHDWQQQVETELRAPDSWLALIGLERLNIGVNTVGSAENSNVPLPASVPPQIGIITVQDKLVTMRVTAEGVKIDGKDAGIGETYTLNKGQYDGELPLVNFGSVTFFAIEREGEYYARIRDANSATRANFKGRKWFPVKSDHRVQATFTPHAAKRVVEVETSKGTISKQQNVGYVEFDLLGETRRLEAFETTGKRLWFIFKDATSGKLTYGAGRFLYAPILADGTIDLDFNKAYHPPCAFSEYAMCPFPPPENVLRFPVEAGEQYNR
ncbi:MAG: DUF1684 domain-containing protein [Chloroflexi bacterium]|nr:DUF1684 domain-containing protein [Chloroflexota bacterium]MCC6892922.1 DUF1684 domain-containing protein [Anaerolineae bacterium]